MRLPHCVGNTIILCWDRRDYWPRPVVISFRCGFPSYRAARNPPRFRTFGAECVTFRARLVLLNIGNSTRHRLPWRWRNHIDCCMGSPMESEDRLTRAQRQPGKVPVIQELNTWCQAKAARFARSPRRSRMVSRLRMTFNACHRPILRRRVDECCSSRPATCHRLRHRGWRADHLPGLRPFRGCERRSRHFRRPVPLHQLLWKRGAS